MPLDGLDYRREYRPRNGLSLCSGGGGLDMGLHIAEPSFHTRCFVEWEPFPRERLNAAQRAGYLAPAPIWDDVTTFDGKPWRNSLDTVLAGYPCQPFSAAGKRQGADDERHLWPDVARIIREIGPRWVFLENVAGHISLGLETVLRDLQEMGFHVAAKPFSAAEIGTSHERLRIFIVAYSKDNCRRLHARQREGGPRAFEPARFGRRMDAGKAMADSTGRRWGERGDAAWPRRSGYPNSGQRIMGNAVSGLGELRRTTGDIHGAGREVAGSRVAETRRESGATGADVADAAQPRPQGRGANRDTQGREKPFGSIGLHGRTWAFPPGPHNNEAWESIVSTAPDLAPAISRSGVVQASLKYFAALHAANTAQSEEHGAGNVEAEPEPRAMGEKEICALVGSAVEPVIRRMADGVAQRSRALKLLGNGVCPLAAANAWRNLARDLGLVPLNLEPS